MKNLSIIIPCYNEQDNIILLLNRFDELLKLDKDLELIIVDNGSTDSSSNIIKDLYMYKNNLLILVSIKKNIGYGYGIMSGVYESNTKFISWCQADLQTDPFDAYYAYKKYNYELCNDKVIIKGKRKGRNFLDIFFTNRMSVVSSFLFKKKLSDINAQPKIFPREFLQYLNDYPKDFSLDLYLLIIAIINNYKIIEFPVIMKKRLLGIAKGGGTFKGKLKLTLKTLKYLFKLRKKLK